MGPQEPAGQWVGRGSDVHPSWMRLWRSRCALPSPGPPAPHHKTGVAWVPESLVETSHPQRGLSTLSCHTSKTCPFIPFRTSYVVGALPFQQKSRRQEENQTGTGPAILELSMTSDKRGLREEAGSFESMSSETAEEGSGKHLPVRKVGKYFYDHSEQK